MTCRAELCPNWPGHGCVDGLLTDCPETPVDDDTIPEDHAYLTDCNCDHEPEQHGWMGCEAEVWLGDLGTTECPCVGHWEY